MLLQAVGEVIDQFNSWGYIDGVTNASVLLAVWVCWELARNFETRRIQPVQALVSTFVMGFGGSTLTAIILGKPWGWLQGNANWMLYIHTALAMYYMPNDLLLNALNSRRAVLYPLFTFVEAVCKSYTISKVGVDGVLFHASGAYSQSLLSALAVGTISGCGGGIIGSMIGVREAVWRFATPPQFVKPNNSMVLSFLATLAYLFMHRTAHVGVFFGGSTLLERVLGTLGCSAKALNAPCATEKQTIAVMTLLIWAGNNAAWARGVLVSLGTSAPQAKAAARAAPKRSSSVPRKGDGKKKAE